jgi:DNA mismatch endonuclease (patch repair protein)
MADYPLPDETIHVPRFEEAAGFYTTPARSKQMGRIRSTNTQPEQLLRRALWQMGIRYRLYYAKIPGKPDLVFVGKKLAIFIDGEFWHGHDWENKRAKIKTNQAFWVPKIERNMQRDRQVNAQLAALGWTVLRFWEQEVRRELGACVAQVLHHLTRKTGDFIGPD